VKPNEYEKRAEKLGFVCAAYTGGLPIQPGSSTVDRGSAHDSLVKVDFVGTQGNTCYDVIRTCLGYEQLTKNAGNLEEGNDGLAASE
jgi:hypothetical protein